MLFLESGSKKSCSFYCLVLLKTSSWLFVKFDMTLNIAQILKKICDHPLLLTKRAAEEVLEEMDSTSNHDDRAVAERLVMQMANVSEKLEEEVVSHDVSCKITFILALLVRCQ